MSFQLADYTKIPFARLSLVYVTRGSQVLLMKRKATKAVLPDTWLGLGGKVEEGESVAASAIREVEEESGLHLHQLSPRGQFAYIDLGTMTGGDIHLFTSNTFSGELVPENREGSLAWHDISQLDSLENFASHQFFFLPHIFDDPNYEYCQTHLYEGNKRVHIFDQVPPFDA